MTLTNGSAVVTGVGTAWQTALIAGGTLYVEADGNPLPILSVDSNTQITAAIKWKGASGTYPYAIMRDTAYGQQTVANANALSTYLQRLDNASLSALASIASTLGAGKVPRGLSANTMEWFTVSDFAKSMLSGADAAAMRVTLGDVFSKNRPIGNDVLTANAADFNNLPGPGLWSLDRGGNQPCINAPPDPNSAAYRCIQIGNGVRGSQIAFNFSEGPMWVRNGYDGWAPWRIVPSSLQSITIGASGGDEADLQTGVQVRLSVNFVARSLKVFAVANWCFHATLASPFEAIGIVLLRDIAAGIDVKSETSTATVTPGDNGMGFRAGRSASLTYDTLTLGKTYQLQLVMYKNQPIGPIYPRQMSINAHNF
ncbi:hypothetical protein N182_28935 [Sinorhizobium sp. GL2]|nr:hypothetical protein N182_28935 [Sinorhizobium sp. GL2]